jgi:glutathione peroxidase
MRSHRVATLLILASGSLLGACKQPMAEKSTQPAQQASSSSTPAPGTPPSANSVPAPAAAPAVAAATTQQAAGSTLHAFTVEGLDGKPRNLAEYRGKVVLVVNTASECGYTPQYEGLQKLHETLSPRGFAVLGFPSTDFGGQEPGSAEQIQEFCSTRFHVTFPLFAKVQVKAGDAQAPLYQWLGASTGKVPAWNFSKYLIGKDGKPIAFWASKTTPDDPALAAEIEKALAAG